MGNRRLCMANACGRPTSISGVQPFTPLLEFIGARPVVRCISPVGHVTTEEDPGRIFASTAKFPMKIGAILTKQDRTYDLTVEEGFLLSKNSGVNSRA
jgi:hypothetical protein